MAGQDGERLRREHYSLPGSEVHDVTPSSVNSRSGPSGCRYPDATRPNIEGEHLRTTRGTG
jgi:hypothetical protein